MKTNQRRTSRLPRTASRPAPQEAKVFMTGRSQAIWAAEGISCVRQERPHQPAWQLDCVNAKIRGSLGGFVCRVRPVSPRLYLGTRPGSAARCAFRTFRRDRRIANVYLLCGRLRQRSVGTRTIRRGIAALHTFIEAQALALGATLVTSNVKEFSRVPGLQVQDWR